MGDPVKNRAVHLPGDRQRAAGKGCGQERHQRGQTRSSPPPAPPGTPGRSRAAAGHGRSPGAGRWPGRRRDGRRDQDGPGAGAGSAAPRLSTETRHAVSFLPSPPADAPAAQHLHAPGHLLQRHPPADGNRRAARASLPGSAAGSNLAHISLSCRRRTLSTREASRRTTRKPVRMPKCRLLLSTDTQL